MTSLIYNTGTVSVSAGSAVVTGNMTGWAVALVTGGLFSCAGVSIPILSVEDDTHLTLAYPWPGATGTGKAYAIARDTSEATRAAWTNDRLATIIQRLSLVGIHPDGSGTLAERDALDPVPATGYIWLYLEAGYDPLFYRKSASGWDGPFEVRGGDGPQGPTGPAGDGFNPAGAWLVGTTYAKNDMVSHGGRTFVSFAGGNVGHEPPDADEDDTYWQFVPAAVGPEGPKGDKGDTGDAGANGADGADGTNGSDGDDGWTPVLAVVADGARYVQQVVDWTGGTGTRPATGLYVGPLGLVALVGDAVNIRGASGSGTGDMLKATYDPNNKAGDAFAMDNMAEGANAKIMTAAERTKLAGIAAGATANDTDANLKNRANHTGTQTLATISDAGTAASKNTGTASGNVPILGAGGKLDEAVIPAVAITDTFVVASQAAMLALSVERGDLAVRTDINKSFVLQQQPASTLANWIELRTPTDAVLSVAGKTGAVTLAKSDVGLGSVDNTADSAKPVSTLQAAAIAAKQDALGYTPVNKAGDTLTGGLTLSGDPSTALMAATKQYVDNNSGGLGVGQTWQSVSRSSGTVYQNTTGKPIEIAYTVTTASSVVYVEVALGPTSAVDVGSCRATPPNSSGHKATLSLVIPPDWYYKPTLGGNGGSMSYMELR